MRVCNRCGHSVVKETLKSLFDDSEYDLCQTCKPAFQDWLAEFKVNADNVTVLKERRGPGRPRKRDDDKK